MSADTRKKRILRAINIKEGSGLEIGPLITPILLRNEADIYYADHMSVEDLQKKYAQEPIDPTKIAPVDYVLRDKTVSEAVGSKKFSYIIASHVIEHIPDIVSWLQDLNKVLVANGVISLAIPDGRFTFDIYRNNSRPADAVGAYIDKRTKVDSATMFDFAAEYRKDVPTEEIWKSGSIPKKVLQRRYSLQEAYDMCLESLKPGKYVDSHTFVFTPYSFLEILKTLIELDLLDYEIADFQETRRNEIEFYVTLKKSSAPKSKRLASIPKIEKPQSRLELEREIELLERQAKALRDEISGVKSSRIWKISAPIRKTIRSRFKR